MDVLCDWLEYCKVKQHISNTIPKTQHKAVMSNKKVFDSNQTQYGLILDHCDKPISRLVGVTH